MSTRKTWHEFSEEKHALNSLRYAFAQVILKKTQFSSNNNLFPHYYLSSKALTIIS